jgi:hypothetical protein
MMALLAGCASSSGVYELSDGRYQIATTAITSFGGAGTARASAIRTAEQFCAERSQRAVIDDAEMDSQFTQGSSQVTFRCEA